MSNLRLIAEERADKKIKFYKNFISYITVNAFLFVLNWIFTPGYWWVFFPIFFWGIGVFVSFLKAYVLTFTNLDTEEYRERKVEQELERLRN